MNFRFIGAKMPVLTRVVKHDLDNNEVISSVFIETDDAIDTYKKAISNAINSEAKSMIIVLEDDNGVISSFFLNRKPQDKERVDLDEG